MRCTNYKPYMIKFVSCWGMFIVWVAMFPQTIKLMLYNYALCIMYHVLFVICIYIPISCIAFGIKYYSKKCISNTLSSIVTGILIVIKVIIPILLANTSIVFCCLTV